MASGRYNLICGDFLTGHISNRRLPVAKSSWSCVMDDSGAIQATVKTFDPGVAALNVPSIAAEVKCFLGVSYEDPTGFETIINAGQVWNHDYDDTTGELTITAQGAWSYWDHRKALAAAIGNGATNTASAGGLAFTGWGLGTIAKKLLQAIGARTNGLPPFVFQADDPQAADDAHSRTYNGWDLAWTGQALRDLTQADGGPEIRFRPIFNPADSRFVQWVMDAGTSAVPLLSNPGGDWIFDTTARQSGVAAVNVSTDGKGMGDIAWARGNGSEALTIMGTSQGSTLTGRGYPLMEVEATGFDSVEKQTTINGYARNALTGAAKRLMTVTIKVHRDANPSLADYLVGDYVQVIVRDNHPYVQGSIRSRIVSMSGDDTPFVSLQLAPVYA